VRLEEVRAGQRAAEARSVVAAAQALVDEQRHAEAIDALTGALERFPGDDAVLMALASAQEAELRQREADEHRRVIEQSAARLGAILDKGDLEGFAKALTKARHEHGEAGEFNALTERAEKLGREKREQEVKAILGEAVDHLELNRYPEAIESLERAGRLAPDNKAIPGLLSQTRKAFREYQAEQAHSQARLRAADEIVPLLASGKLDEAEARLKAVAAEHGGSEVLDELGARLQGLRDEEREKKAKALLREATTSIEQFDFAAGIMLIGQALVLKPGDAALVGILAKAREAEAEHARAEQKRQELAEAVAGIDELITAGRLERAEQRLAVVVRKFGESEDVADVRRRLHTAVGFQRQTEKRIEEALSTARSLIAIQDFNRAIEVLREASTLAPDNAETVALVEEVELAFRKHVEERRRLQEISDATGVIEAAIKAGSVGDAKRALLLAERLFGGEPAIRSMRVRIEKLEVGQRRAAIEASIEEARSLADSGFFEKATVLLQQAKAVDPKDHEVTDLLLEMPARQARAAVEKCLAQGKVEDARRALELAEKLYGSEDPILQAVRAKLAKSKGR
jgi:tetratricopeptide (TPR) repeat protein